MLTGRAVMQIANGQTVGLDAGMALHIPSKTRHAIVNQTDEKIRFLVISAPSSRGDRHEVVQDK